MKGKKKPEYFISYCDRRCALRNWRNSLASSAPSLFKSAARNATVAGSLSSSLLKPCAEVEKPESPPCKPNEFDSNDDAEKPSAAVTFCDAL